ncbi:hypothetical protein D3C71_1405850 [compost metagenome]
MSKLTAESIWVPGLGELSHDLQLARSEPRLHQPINGWNSVGVSGVVSLPQELVNSCCWVLNEWGNLLLELSTVSPNSFYIKGIRDVTFDTTNVQSSLISLIPDVVEQRAYLHRVWISHLGLGLNEVRKHRVLLRLIETTSCLLEPGVESAGVDLVALMHGFPRGFLPSHIRTEVTNEGLKLRADASKRVERGSSFSHGYINELIEQTMRGRTGL